MSKPPVIRYETIARPAIHTIRGETVVLDRDVARYFGVPTKVFNQQVKRHERKFGTYLFRLTEAEWKALKSQIVTSNGSWGGDRYLPNAFTEHGVVMAATILKSPRADEASRYIVETFVAARREHLKARPAAKAKSSLMRRISDALAGVLNAIINPRTKGTVRSEAVDAATEGINSLTEYLKRPRLQNEKTLAEIRKLTAEAEAIDIETASKRTADQKEQLQLLATKLELILKAQRYAGIEGTETFLNRLADFSPDQVGE